MLDSLKDFLYRSATPELSVVLEETDKLFERLELRSQDIAIQQIMETVDSATNSDAMSDVLSVYMDNAEQVIKAHGIEYDNLTLPMMNIIIRGLLGIQDNENYEAISDICESEDQPVEKLHKLLELSTGLESITFEENVVDVDPAFIDRLIELIEPELELMDVRQHRLDDDIRKRLVWWRLHYPDTSATRFVSENIPLGLTTDIYMSKFDSETFGRLHDNDEFAAKELLGIIFISGVKTNDILTKASELVDGIFTDMGHVFRVDERITHMLRAYNNG